MARYSASSRVVWVVFIPEHLGQEVRALATNTSYSSPPECSCAATTTTTTAAAASAAAAAALIIAMQDVRYVGVVPY
jgi:hypothetical protein